MIDPAPTERDGARIHDLTVAYHKKPVLYGNDLEVPLIIHAYVSPRLPRSAARHDDSGAKRRCR